MDESLQPAPEATTPPDVMHLLQRAPAGIWVLDERGATRWTNDALGRMLGTSPSEMSGTPPLRFVDERDRAAFTSLITADGVSRPIALHFRGADGRPVSLAVIASHWASPHRTGTVLALSTIASDRAGLEQLRRHESQLREAEQLGSVGTWEWDVTGGEFRGSDELYRIYGLTPGVVTLTLQSMLERTMPEDRIGYMRFLDDIAAGGGGRSHERRIMRPNGDVRTVQTMTAMLDRDDSGHSARVLGVSRDITAEQDAFEWRVRSRELYEREREVALRLREVDELRFAFMSMVSSDLRGPLATVFGGASTLRDLGASIDPDTERTLLDQTIEQGRILEGLLTDVLDLERLRHSPQGPSFRLVELGSFVRSVIDAMEVPAVAVRVHGGGEVDVDPTKLTRIVDNLVRNAIRVGGGAAGVEVDVRVEGDLATIEVADRGPSIPTRAREDLFTAKHAVVATDVPGRSAISMSIVGRFVRIHDGTIRVEDREGGGSRIVVQLPRTRSLARTALAAARARAATEST